MRKIITPLILIVTLCTGIASAQTNLIYSINSSGGKASGSSGSASYSVGQLFYKSFSSTPGTSGGSIYHGIQQPIEVFTEGIRDESISSVINVFPNPSGNQLNLVVENKGLEKLNYSVYDINGRLLFTHNINNVTTVVEMKEYSSGTYILKVSDKKSALKSFTIIKNN